MKRGTAVAVGLVVAGLAAGIALKIHGVRKPPEPKPVLVPAPAPEKR